MKQTLALLALVLLGFMAGIPAASARERYGWQDGYGRSNYSVEGRIRYDSQGNAYWDQGLGSRSGRYDYRYDRDNQDGYYRRNHGSSGSSRDSCAAATGRIRYDSQGVAYWDAGC
jgi:hypothetical protein